MTQRDEHGSGGDALAALLAGRRTAVLTGAGLSTDSGIPDYRGDGSKPRRNPMTFHRFVSSEDARRRYWAGSAMGWLRFARAQPNAGHLALADLQHAGHVDGIATQNVDGLHRRAGTTGLVELHGSLDTVTCLDCGTTIPRAAFDALLRERNPWLPDDPDAVPLNPDGDAEFTEIDTFVVPPCPVCGGMLKPDVVFFGEFVRPEVTRAGERLVDRSDALLVAGSSLAVNTGVRLVHRAKRAGLPVAIVNRGPTAVDALADVRVEGGTSDVLASLAEALTGAPPRPAGPLTDASGPRAPHGSPGAAPTPTAPR